MSSTRQLLHSIATHLSPRRKRQIAFLAFITVCSALAEFVSLGTVLPFLAVLAEPERIWSASWVRSIAAFAGWFSPSQLIVPAAGAFGVAAVMTASIRVFNLWIGGRLAASIGSDLSCEAYRRTLLQPYAVHLQRNSSQVINSITGQIGATVSALNVIVVTATSTLVSISLLIGMLVIDATAAVASAFVFGGIYFLIGFLSYKNLVANGEAFNASRISALKSLQEGLGAIRDVILDSTQDFYLENYRRSDRRMRLCGARNRFLSSYPRFFLEAVGLLLIACLACLIVHYKGGGGAALPLIGAFALGAQRLLPALQQAYSGWSSLKAFNADLEGVMHMLEQPLPTTVSPVNSLVLNRSIRFRDVSFRYKKEGPCVLNSLSLEIMAGERIGFIGATGSGKSTLLDLMMGLLFPSSGLIEIDGNDLHDSSRPDLLAEWGAAIAHVPQNIYLTDSSIAENIALGIPSDQIDQSRLRFAARQAQIASFIEASPGGYDSFVGERGIRLSGGQRQRLGIARALYKQAQVLVLDEATSALDNDTEQAVMDAINQLDRNLTVVIIAHRLSTVALCDRVIRLDQGRVVADGPPSVVLAEA